MAHEEFVLSSIFTGYFAAGGIAGAISRTATAPLDRLKVENPETFRMFCI